MPAPEATSFPAELAISHPAATKLLVDPKARDFLKPFLGRACGLSEAARQLGVGRSLVSYWVGRLRDAGLMLPLTDPAGRRLWRSSADAFVVALRDMPMDSDAAVLANHMDGAYDRMKQALLRVARQEESNWRFRVFKSDQGLVSEIQPHSGKLADVKLLNNRATVHLSPAQAAALRAELAEVLKRYVQMHAVGPGRKRHSAWVCAVEDLP